MNVVVVGLWVAFAIAGTATLVQLAIPWPKAPAVRPWAEDDARFYTRLRAFVFSLLAMMCTGVAALVAHAISLAM